ncbi:MAG TPA: coenzyme F420-0:L-glutamate ligase [Solirubrobacteraceae bacterium]|nr:coenzyme F420-0:L-glutamate ligase [Solirubrobacteraceae bacterium]
MGSLNVRAVPGLPEVRIGEDLAALIAEAAVRAGAPLADGEIVVVAHKVVSKAEGAVVALGDVEPGEQARELAARFAAETGQPRDPRAVQVVLDQTREVVRAERGVLISRTHHGFVCANAGVDASNAAEDTLVLLPRDPDGSARRLRAGLAQSCGVEVAVLIADSFGRAWRHGQVDVAIGLAGLDPLQDWRGRHDARGMQLRATWLALADALAALGELVRAKDSGEPVAVVAGLERLLTVEDGPGAAALLRPAEEDLFL